MMNQSIATLFFALLLFPITAFGVCRNDDLSLQLHLSTGQFESSYDHGVLNVPANQLTVQREGQPVEVRSVQLLNDGAGNFTLLASTPMGGLSIVHDHETWDDEGVLVVLANDRFILQGCSFDHLIVVR